MYACLCAAVKNTEILALKKQGLSLQEIIEMTAAGMSCGTCKEYIVALYEDEK